jgi:ribosomal protein S1
LQALPVGARIAAEVIGRQHFGVFLRIADHPDAIGLAEVSAMPNCRCLTLPKVGEQVTGAVIWHADHNHQVKVQLDAWAQHPDRWPEWADAVGQIVTGTVTKLTPIGVFVRIGDCVEGFIPRADMPLEYGTDPASGFREGRTAQVRVDELDLIRRRVRLAPA